MINLVSKVKPEESQLSDTLVQLLNNQEPETKNKTKYIYYDFHEETSGNNFSKINDLIKQINGV